MSACKHKGKWKQSPVQFLSRIFFFFLKPYAWVGWWTKESRRTAWNWWSHSTRCILITICWTQWFTPGDHLTANRCQSSLIITELMTNLSSFFFLFLSRKNNNPERCGFHNIPNNEQRSNPLFAFVIREDGWKGRGWSLNSIITLD